VTGSVCLSDSLTHATTLKFRISSHFIAQSQYVTIHDACCMSTDWNEG